MASELNVADQGVWHKLLEQADLRLESTFSTHAMTMEHFSQLCTSIHRGPKEEGQQS